MSLAGRFLAQHFTAVDSHEKSGTKASYARNSGFLRNGRKQGS